ncbi:protein phosphatase 2C domain-containing protein [Pseudomonas sp. SZMC_28357]|uniref:PP2C family protein-serine/threonine phosphatase n=1 Tax=Pseudomonas sp. SZMC_28357 TaxID=3074380 RepID=UPI002871854F|nr:protein phosphatase 2C domain-containing protein [Pseudomonas sp. SZMC_28357]MDR9751373.1 protein phosphatase 2C domain-containing protein [Pseudomonas sp. SZMC_28357]
MTHCPLGVPGPHRLTTALAFGLSDTGPVRQHNEDNFLVDTDLQLLAVADGMGGHEAGAQASAMALDTLRECLSRPPAPAPASVDPDATCRMPAMGAIGTLQAAIEQVNARLYAQNEARRMSDGQGMGTTLTGVWRCDPMGPLILFHVGDSRLYRLRNGDLQQLSRDQTWYQQALDAGHFDRLPSRNLLLQAIGPSRKVEPEIALHQVQRGDVLMLCSDGVHGSVPHHELAQWLGQVSGDSIAEVCEGLIRLAADYGGRDNATVLLALCEA